ISAIFSLYRSQLGLYRRFFHYIDHNLNYIGDSTRNIDQPTNNDNIRIPLPYFNNYITITFMLKYSK
ncbi:TPA: hypothetical protein ACTZ5N_003770, partial [Bacillus cereus]